MTSGKPSPELLAMLGLIDANEYLRRSDEIERHDKRHFVSQETKDKLRESHMVRWRKRRAET